jgi:hypothetical protein
MNKENVKSFFKDSVTLSIMITFILIAFTAVTFRMRGVELDYEKTKITKQKRETIIRNKQFKAKRAKLLSIENLNTFAKKLKMSEPKPKQIIVIPETIK